MSDHMKRNPNARHTGGEGGKGNKQEAIKSTIQERSNNTRQIIKTREVQNANQENTKTEEKDKLCGEQTDEVTKRSRSK